MRLIDADALEKRMEDRLKSLRKAFGYYDHYTDGFEEGCVAVEDAEAVDAVPVVRCKDCKYHKDTSVELYAHCCLTGQTVEKNDFCSYGERKDDE